MNSKISDKDRKAWEKFLSNKEKLLDKDIKKKNEKKFKTREIDLHGYTLDDANKKIESLIHDSYDDGVNKLRIVTGKGLHSENEKNPYVSKDLSILKYSVPEFVKHNNNLMNLVTEFQNAPKEDGGEGVLYIFLKKKL